MSWIRSILVLLCLFLLTIIGATLYVLTQDLAELKGPLEQLITRQTGRQFSIGGRFQLKIGRQTSLIAGGISFGNPAWAQAEEMVRVDNLEIIVDLWSLVRGPLVIELIKIDGARIALEADDSGATSWTFGAEKESSSGDDKGGPSLAFILQLARVHDLRLSYASPNRPEPLRINVASFEQSRNSEGMLTASLKGSINDKPVDVSGNYGPLKNLLSGQDLQYDIAGQFDTLTITSTGKLDDVLSPRRPELELHIKGPDINHVTDMLGVSGLGAGTLDLDASLKPAGKNMELAIEGNLGPYSISGGGQVRDLSKLQNAEVQLNIEGPNLGRVTRLFGLEGIPEDPFDLSGKVTRSGKHLDVDEVILNIGGVRCRLDGAFEKFPSLNGAKLNLTVRGPDLGRFRVLFGLPDQASGPYRIEASMRGSADGTEAIDIRGKSNLGQFSLSGVVTEPPNFIGTHLKYSVTGDSLQAYANTLGVPGLMAEPFSVDGEFEVANDQFDLNETFLLSVGDHQTTVSGTFGIRPIVRGTDVHFRVKGPDIAEIARMFGLEKGVPARAYDITGQLAIENEEYRVTGLQAAIGDARMTLDGTINGKAGFAGSSVSFSATVPSLAALVGPFENFEVPSRPFTASGKVRLEAEELRLQTIALKGSRGEIHIDATVGLPFKFPDDDSKDWGSHSGDFDIDAKGTDLRSLLPATKYYRPDASPFEVRVKGKWRDDQWTFENSTISVADARLVFSGRLDEPQALLDTDLKIEVRIPSLSRLGLINGKRLPDALIDLDAHFAATPSTFEIDHMNGRIGSGDVRGRLEIQLDKDVPDITIDIDSDLLDLTRFISTDVTDAEELEALDNDGAGDDAGDGRVIPDWLLPLEQMRKFNADVSVDAGQLRIGQSVFNDFALHARIADGQLILKRLAGAGPAGTFSGSLSIVPTGDKADVTATLQGSKMYLAIDKQLTEEDARLAPRYDADISISGSGISLREVASTLNGKIRVTSDGGRAGSSILSILFGDFFQEIISAVNPFSKDDPYTEISCVAALGVFKNGILEIDPGIVVQTDKMNIVSKGSIDFRQEKLDLNFKTGARKGIGISAGEFINPYIKVAGTLADPKLKLDRQGTLVVGGAAVATAGLSILAKAAWDRVFREKDPCGAAIAEADKREGA